MNVEDDERCLKDVKRDLAKLIFVFKYFHEIIK